MPVIIPLLIASILGSGVISISQTSLPGEFLFPVKTFTEDVRVGLTGNAENKIILHAELAEERIGEISDLLEQKRVDAKGLKIAMARLEDQTLKASSLLESEKNKGKDLSELTERIDIKIRANELALNLQEDKLKAREDDLSSAISEAESRGDSNRTSILLAERSKITGLRSVFEDEFERVSNVFSRIDAAHDIKEAEAKKQKLINEANLQGLSVSADKIAEIENHIALAVSAFSAGRFEEAEDQAHFARDVIRFLDDTIIDPNLSGGSGADNSGPGSINGGGETENRGGEFELRGRINEAGEDVRGNADEPELRGRENEPGEDVRGQELEIRGPETEARGRVAEGEVSRGDDSSISVSGQSSGSDDMGLDDKGGSGKNR